MTTAAVITNTMQALAAPVAPTGEAGTVNCLVPPCPPEDQGAADYPTRGDVSIELPPSPDPVATAAVLGVLAAAAWWLIR